jgi:HJR/Mrr/RecB family endonuclease
MSMRQPHVFARWATRFRAVTADESAEVTRRRLSLDEARDLAPTAFVAWVARGLRELGYTVDEAAPALGPTVDLVARQADVVAVVQCRRYHVWSTDEADLRELVAAIASAGAQRALLITTGRLTPSAARWVVDQPVEVWDRDRLVEHGLVRSPACSSSLAGLKRAA